MEKPGEVSPIYGRADIDERLQYLRPKLHLPVTPPPLRTPQDLPAAAETDHPTVSSSSVAPFRKRVLPKFLARCHAAFADIHNPIPEWYACPWNYKSDYFDFHRFCMWFDENIPAWPEGSDPPAGADGWVDVYRVREYGPSVMAFICNEGVIVAADCSVIGRATSPSCDHKFIRFNSHVIGCIAGGAADCELFLSHLPAQLVRAKVLKMFQIGWLRHNILVT